MFDWNTFFRLFLCVDSKSIIDMSSLIGEYESINFVREHQSNVYMSMVVVIIHSNRQFEYAALGNNCDKTEAKTKLKNKLKFNIAFFHALYAGISRI